MSRSGLQESTTSTSTSNVYLALMFLLRATKVKNHSVGLIRQKQTQQN